MNVNDEKRYESQERIARRKMKEDIFMINLNKVYTFNKSTGGKLKMFVKKGKDLSNGEVDLLRGQWLQDKAEKQQWDYMHKTNFASDIPGALEYYARSDWDMNQEPIGTITGTGTTLVGEPIGSIIIHGTVEGTSSCNVPFQQWQQNDNWKFNDYKSFPVQWWEEPKQTLWIDSERTRINNPFETLLPIDQMRERIKVLEIAISKRSREEFREATGYDRKMLLLI